MGRQPTPPNNSPRLAGILLTGGASRRMGVDKATIEILNTTLAARTARLLSRVAAPVFEVGPGHTDLPNARESAPGSGPLAALADGVRALADADHDGPALLLATDLPGLTLATLTRLSRWPGSGSVIPTVRGRPQPLCARWGPAELAAAVDMVAAGESAMHALLSRPAITRVEWPEPDSLADVDTPADLARFTRPSHPGSTGP